ncbi:MAG: peptidoglycan-associated lipoprotein Pal [Proteobacteria bacterium]|nr:peptidoglycan-associated lipoprotein Pal [Pseudomonadota bacterium]
MLRLLLSLPKSLGIIALACLVSFCTTPDEPEEMEEVVMDLPPVPDIDVEIEESLPEMEEVLGDQANMPTEPEFVEETTAPFTGASPIYFAFDDSSVTPDAELELEKLVTYLNENPMTSVKVEGHCDERGTVEYNLALGEKRALSVKNYLVTAGVDGSRVTTVSYGEETPAVAGNDEFAWSQNRRVEFTLDQNL